MTVPSWLIYQNQSAGRNQPLNPQLIDALSFLPEMGVEFRVFSGGNDPKHPIGSTRHNHGLAADGFFYKDGRKLDWANKSDIPVLQEIVARGKQQGLTGFGAGKGYMQPGSMHVGFGKPAVWGRGGDGVNAPWWLTEAYNNGAPKGQGSDSLVGAAKASYQPPVNGIPGQRGYTTEAFPEVAPPPSQRGYTTEAFPKAPTPGQPNYTTSAFPSNQGDVLAAGSPGVGSFKPTAFQQHSARQAMEGDPSQTARLLKAAGLDPTGKKRLEPLMGDTDSLLSMMKKKMEQQSAAAIPGAAAPPGGNIFGNIFGSPSGGGGGLMSFLSGLFK